MALAPQGTIRVGIQTMTHNCIQWARYVLWRSTGCLAAPKGQQTHPSWSRLFSTAQPSFRIHPKPPFQLVLPSRPPPSTSSYMELPRHFWRSPVPSLIHTWCLSPEPGMCFYPFFQNTNCPQGSAPMAPLRKISPNPKSKRIILFLASYQHVVSMSGISLSCS